jgi:hypothetical protein
MMLAPAVRAPAGACLATRGRINRGRAGFRQSKLGTKEGPRGCRAQSGRIRGKQGVAARPAQVPQATPPRPDGRFRLTGPGDVTLYCTAVSGPVSGSGPPAVAAFRLDPLLDPTRHHERQDWAVPVLAGGLMRFGRCKSLLRRVLVTQVEADHESATPSRAATTAPRHHHQHHYRHSAVSLLGASVFTRLAIVAGVAVVLWIAIVWALT